MSTFPVLMHTAVDATDCRGLAEFYREFLGLRYRPGDEIPADGNDEDADWLVLLDAEGNRVLAFQEVRTLPRPTWPSHKVPKQMHHDFESPVSKSSSGTGGEPKSWAQRCLRPNPRIE
jgi:Glyoxalase-like domain